MSRQSRRPARRRPGPSPVAAPSAALATALALVGVLARQASVAAAAYSCEPGESIGEVQGETGNLCTPRCDATTFDCPASVPPGVTAQPQCMLQDVNKVAYCGLLCQVDSQCPSGAVCRTVSSPEVSLCVHPLSYSEWASGQAQRIKLSVGFPATAAQNARGFQIAKAQAALQSMKRRFGIPDSDGDVLTVRELLAFASSAHAAGATAGQQAHPGGMQPFAGNPGTHQGGPLGAWKHDVNYFVNNLESGVPGIEREIHDTVWNLEHLEKRGVCSEILRSVVLLGALYLVVGCAYKNQAMGATGIDMIPHIHFWTAYPALVNDGIKYAQIFANVYLGGGHPEVSGGGGGGGGFLGAHRGSNLDRDTFSSFEPLK